VILNRFLAPLWVFIFGIMISVTTHFGLKPKLTTEELPTDHDLNLIESKSIQADPYASNADFV